uniref:Uncharacterized protein n=1 Tax=viral metagenome TaxID=1070528 RepID=A0A6M3IIY3_9ZZZZ
MDEVERITEHLKKAGAEVRPGSDLPEDVRAEIDEKARNMPQGKVGVEVHRLADEQVYVYDDERLTLTIPIPSVPIFMAFVDELAKLDNSEGLNYSLTAIARAFWLLHQKPNGMTGPRVPKPKDHEAIKFLAKRIPSADVALGSLPKALYGLIAYSIGKKKVADTPTSAESPKPSPE